jgi:hypothetical protein
VSVLVSASSASSSCGRDLLHGRVQVQLALASEHARGHGGERLGGRGDVVARVRRGRVAGEVAHAEGVECQHLAVLDDRQREPGSVERRERGVPALGEAGQRRDVRDTRCLDLGSLGQRRRREDEKRES